MAELLDQARRDAVHFRHVAPPPPCAFLTPKPMVVILCGQPIERRRDGSVPWTDQVDAVTCRQCVEAIVARQHGGEL